MNASLQPCKYNNCFVQKKSAAVAIVNNTNSINFRRKNLLTQDVFVKAKLISKGQSAEKFVDAILDRLYAYEDVNAKHQIKKYIKEGKILLSKSLYRTALRNDTTVGTCSIFVNSRDDIHKHILNGNGLAINLNNEEKPVESLLQIDDLTLTIGKSSVRPPAGLAALDINNKDILKFLNYKNDKDYSQTCFSTSVFLPEGFLEKVDKDEFITLTDKKQVKAKFIYDKIIDSILKKGNPGIIYENKLNNANSIPSHKYHGVSTCAEMGLEQGELSMFSYINLSEFFKNGKIDYKQMNKATQILTETLNKVIDMNEKNKLYSNDVNINKRRFGIGVCGYADLIAKMGLEYGSKEALEVLEHCLEMINYASKESSMKVAKRNGTFKFFTISSWKNKDFFIKHNNQANDSPVTDKMWEELFENVQKYGLRNASTTALPPTCSSATMAGTTMSIEPYFSLRNNMVFEEALKNLNLTNEQQKQVYEQIAQTDSCQNIDFLSVDFKKVFKVATEIDFCKHIDTVAHAQKYVDDGISKTVNLPHSATSEDIDNVIRYANKHNIKGIAIYRN